MQHVQLDFRAAPGAESRIGKLLAVLGILAIVVVGIIYGGLVIAQQDADRDRIAQRADSRRQAEADRAAAMFDPDGEIVKRLGRPWQKLLLAIESVSDPKALLVEIRPDPSRKLLRLTGESATLEDALNYLTQLQGLEVLERAHLVSYGPVPTGGIRFILQAEWVGS